jgi:hypothetical protein
MEVDALVGIAGTIPIPCISLKEEAARTGAVVKIAERLPGLK